MLKKKKGIGKSLQALYVVGSFGLTMGASILLGYWLGSYIDRRLGTSPWFMLLFLLLFMVGAFIKFFQAIKEIDRGI